LIFLENVIKYCGGSFESNILRQIERLIYMKNLTEGKPMKIIWWYALPMMLGQITQQLYNFVDSAIVGNYVSTLALGAVGATTVVSNMLIGFVNSGTLGLAIPIAKYYGAKDYETMRKCIFRSAFLTLCTTILLTAASLLTIHRILVLLGTPENIIQMSYDYVTIILAGMIFVSTYNFCANLLRAVGDSRTPLIFLGISVLLNIVLDLTFIRIFNMGVKGAAAATVISQAVSAVTCLIYIFKKCPFLIPNLNEHKVSSADGKDLVYSALSMGFMSCIVNIGTIILQKAINGLGPDIVTAHTAARKVFDIFTVMLYIVGNAMTTYVSQNMGAGRIDRIKQGIRAGLMINTLITTGLMVIGWAFAPILIRFITGTDSLAIIAPAVRYIRISISCFYVLGPLFVLRCSMQGMGRKLVPVFSSSIELVGKILAVMILTPRLGYLGVTITEPIIWAVCTIMLSIMYFTKPPEKLMIQNKIS
jgi:putative MATE family efflux protein